MKETRINKYLSEIGYCSRRAADKLINDKKVTINGKVPKMGTKVKARDKVAVDGKLVSNKPQQKLVYILLNKPRGVVCTAEKREKKNIIDFINYPQRIYPVGRLDKTSEGLILLTNDGEFMNQIIHARNTHEKEYLVTVNKPLTKRFLESMASGVPILDTVTRPCVVEALDKMRFRIILTQGLNRQIRRMCEYLEYDVKRLKRIRIMNIKLDTKVGEWRDLTQEEVNNLKELCSK